MGSMAGKEKLSGGHFTHCAHGIATNAIANAPIVDAGMMCIPADSINIVLRQWPMAAVIAQYFIAERGVLLMLAKPIDARAEKIMSSSMVKNMSMTVLSKEGDFHKSHAATKTCGKADDYQCRMYEPAVCRDVMAGHQVAHAIYERDSGNKI